ncbi:MAG: hypothetical protein AUJ51_07075 [Elusimicrobia bacterium CG1_02_56_21]|nr:MAG: hypothetical protein AUJ51_07075 [Elusimicrobia bacterium CG1_02_56_21]
MKNTKIPGILAVAILFSAAFSAAAAEVDFDGGIDLQAFLEAAQSRGPAVPARPNPDFDVPVWISVDNGDIEVLGSEFPFAGLKAAARTQQTSVYKVNSSELAALSGIMHRKLHKCGGFFTHSSFKSAEKDLSAAPASASRAYTIDQGARIVPMLKLVDEKAISGTIEKLSAYKNRYYTSQTGVASAKWLQDYWRELAAGRQDISVEAYPHKGWAQESVILTVRGAFEPQKIVVLGGHLDSISRGGNNSTAPGADDNASGIAALTEAIRVIVASGYKPAMTIKFMGYAAEEVGLRGSQDIAAAFKKQGAEIEGSIQFDMTNFNGSAEDIFLITDYTNAAQNAFLGGLVSAYTDYRLGETKCGYACSDHASWTKNGFPASFPFESSFGDDNPFIHTPNDTISQSGGHALHALKFAKLAVAYLVETAK